MDRHRGGDRYGSSNPDSHQFRHSRAPSRSSDDDPAVNYHHNRRSPPINYHQPGFSGGGRDNRAFDSPPRFPPGGGGGGGFRPMGSGGGDRGGLNSNHQILLTGQKRGFPFSGRGGSPGSLVNCPSLYFFILPFFPLTERPDLLML